MRSDYTRKKMFGEYGLYCNDKIVAFVCDDQLYVKPTLPGREFIVDLVEGYPYPGAKPYFLISGELWDDAEWMAMLIKITSEALPLPPIKKAKGRA